MSTLRDQLSEKQLLVSDGAWGTLLMAQGLSAGACPELWNVEHGEAVCRIAEGYIACGADIVTTNSFGGSRFKLEAYGLAERVAELNVAAATLSRAAAKRSGYVAASIGPSGKMLITEEVSEKELYNAFCEQAEALAQGGADGVLIETMSALDEALVAIRAVKENTQLDVLCTFTYERKVDGVYRTMMGVSPAEMATAAIDAGADAVGTNCSQGPAEMVEIVQALRDAAADVPIIVQPNAGMPVPASGGVTYPETPGSMAAYVHDLVAAGATIIGGCCGTTPDHIRAIAAAVDRERAN